MAATESRIRILFDGSAAGVIAASKQAQAAIRGLNDDSSKLAKAADKTGSGLLAISKGLAALGSAGGAVSTVGATAGAVAQLAPAALVLPGALLAGAAAMGTFKLATAGMGDALKAGLAGDMEKFAESTKDMAPAMQQAAKTVVAFRPQLDDLRKSVQTGFWDQFSVGIKNLGDNLLPVLRKSLPALSTELGNISKQAVNMLGQPAAINDVREILDNTTATLRNMRPALANVLSGFLGIAGVGATYLPRLGDAINDVAARFKSWVDDAVESGRLNDMIDGAIAGFKDLGAIVGNIGSSIGSIFRGLGGDVSSPLASLRELTGQVAEFLKTVEAQDGLRALGDTLRVVGDVVGKVVMTALRELMPTLVELAPVAQEVARTLGDLLVDALETLGPMIRGAASVLAEFPGVVGLATTAVVGFVAAVKTLKTVNAVTDLLGIERMFSGIGKSAAGAGKAAEAAGKTAGIAWGKGFTGSLALIGAGAAGTIVLDQVLPRDAAKTYGSQAARDMLGEMAKTFSGEESNIFRTWDVARWVSNPISMAVEVGRRELMKLFEVANTAIPPLQFDVNTGPAQSQVADFLNSVKGQAGEVNINGRTENAAQAVAELVQRIRTDPGAEVTINGRTMPAQDALAEVIDLINRGVGLVTVNGETKPAGDALAEFLRIAQGSTATANLNADAALAYETVGGWTRAAEGTVGAAQLDANPGQANARLGEWVGGVSRARGTATLDANPQVAYEKVGGWTRAAEGTVGMARLNANPAQANAATSGWQGTANRTTATASLAANTASANSSVRDFVSTWNGYTIRMNAVVSSRIGGLARGGPVYGPGTGTSDTAGLFALSKGEHVLTAREVAAAGGHAAIFQMRRALLGGRGVPRMTARMGRAAAGGSVTSAGALSMPAPQVSVAVRIGERDITDLVRTEIHNTNRLTRRTVLAGAGTSF